MNKGLLAFLFVLVIIACGIGAAIKFFPPLLVNSAQNNMEQSVTPTTSVFEDATVITMTVGSFAQIQDNLVSRITEHDQEMAQKIVDVSHAGDLSQTVMSSTASFSWAVYGIGMLIAIAVLAFLISGKK